MNIKRLSSLCLMALLLSSHVCEAKVARQKRTHGKRMVFSNKRDFSRGMNAASIQPIFSTRGTSDEDISKIIPRNLQDGSSGTVVATQILDHSLTNFFNSPLVRDTGFGRAATQVEKTMEGDIAIGGRSPDSIRHEFKFAMRPVQTRAQLDYTGLTNAHLSYQVAASQMDLEVREPMSMFKTDVVYNHVARPNDKTNMLSLRWGW